MSTKTVKGRVSNKHKTEAEWLLDVYPNGDRTQDARTDAFIPLAGELIIYDPDSNYNYYRFKFGNGTDNVDALSFITEDSTVPSISFNVATEITPLEVFDKMRARGLTGQWTVVNFSGRYTDCYGLFLNWYGDDVYSLTGINLANGGFASNTNAWRGKTFTDFQVSFDRPLHDGQYTALNTTDQTILGAINELNTNKVETTDSRLSDSRTPKSHTHGNITNDGTITSTAVTSATGVLVYDSNNKIQRTTAANARSIIGAGTSNFDGNYNSLTNKPTIPTYWANVALGTSANDNTTPTFNPAFKVKVATNNDLNPSADWAWASPIAKYLWHDLLAFRAAKFESSTDGATWTQNTAENYTKMVTNQKESQELTIIDDSKPYCRFTWLPSTTSKTWHACQAQWLVIGFTWVSSAATCTIKFQTTSDGGTTWTDACSVSVAGNSTPHWIKLDSSKWSNCYGVRLIFTRTSSAGSTAISSVKWLTPRWGNQGFGSEAEFPYEWNNNQDIYPRAAKTSSLGLSSKEWANVYTEKINGVTVGSTPKFTDTNTAHSHSAGVGLLLGDTNTGGTSGTVIYKAALVDETKSANAATYTAGGVSKFYAVQLDKDGKLGVSVPWEAQLNPTDYYWANIKIGSTSSTDKKPTFGGATISGDTLYVTGQSGHREGIRLAPVGGLSSIWWNATGEKDYTTGQMWGITAYSPSFSEASKKNTFRFRGPTSSTATSATDQMWIDANGLVTSRGGFAKSGSSNSYILLAGGGTKAVSDFITSHQSLSHLVTLATEQEITAKKTFSVTGSTQKVEITNTQVRLCDDANGFNLQYDNSKKAMKFVFN